jgi:hypothetical protein
MLYKTLSIFAISGALAFAGCRDSGSLQPADLAGTGGADMATGGGGDMPATYTTATVKAMRQGAPGSYELDNVVAIALTPSSTSPHLYVQDADGGDFSAIKANCSSSSTSHPCSVASTVHTVAIGHSVTIKGLYIKAKASEGGAENFYIDSITDNGAGTAPAPAMVALTDISRNAMTKAKWFQKVTVTTPGTLVVYDLSPTELVFANATKCSYQLGFGLAPMGTAGAATTLSCPNATSQPAASTAPDPAEILIGTDFYTGFNVSSDCRCAAMYMDKEVTATSTATALSGILVFDTVYGSMPVKAYQYIAPTSTTDLTLSNLM